MGEKTKKIVKTIKIDADKCNGCRACEVVCSAFHAAPKYSGNNPARSRIQVIRHPLKDIYIPVYAGEYTAAECMGRDKYVIDGKEYDECAFCRASCPSRDIFKEPDSTKEVPVSLQAKVYYKLGAIYESYEDDSTAKLYFKKALEISADSEWGKNARKKL